MRTVLPKFPESNEGDYPFFLKPNLGFPTLLNLRDHDPEIGGLKFKTLVLALREHSEEIISSYFQSNAFIQPILKDEGAFYERRGEIYHLSLVKIEKIEKLVVKPEELKTKRDCIVLDLHHILLSWKAKLGKRTSLFELEFEIDEENIPKFQEILNTNENAFLLFDLIQKIPETGFDRVNYHGLAVYDKNWKDFSFIHASDSHIAWRNDHIIEFLKQQAREESADKFILTRDYEYKQGIQEDKLERLHFCKYNFNYNLRKLITFSNQKAALNELDFMILGGDLIDYLETSNINNHYRNNFLVFLDIILGVNRENSELPDDEEYKNSKELLVPLFTLTGNHDYRKAHYDMVFSGTYKVFGFTEEEISEYKDQKKFKPLRAIKSNIRQLRDYLVFINPTLNYMVNIGDRFNLIFMDTGADSLKEFYELLKGGSSTKGLKDYQIDILRSEAIQSKDHTIIAILHSPPISPKVSTLKRIKFKKKASLGSLDFYSKKFKVFMGAGRIDNVINLKYQSFKDHWSSLLKILIGQDLKVKRKLDMVFCGHTHTSVEYTLIETEEDQVFRRGVVFAPSYVRLPCDTVTGDFSDELNQISDMDERTSWLKENKPLIFQTQGLGPFAHRSKFVPPGFRYISVKKNQLSKIRTYSLHLK